eukprot:Plantae.Rhodophyta-Hildenbrandia_rubra.ctg4302.p2 GENE.Plantae.Rhodophyta-Hildenbrandia_rubra.ctg4302~~Plantae.Rhodophyta-Hildenbrandia_rubra.ctg4302.p2  ORF type:complete len:532 (+),score=67.94 Plantae.Rhodophyta-Hildenbrandia_rubra.ctg4302:2469-4064(+)
MQSNFLQRRFLSDVKSNDETIHKNKFDDAFSQDVVDIETLRGLCLVSGFPKAHRGRGWKILLGVLPPRRGAWEVAEKSLKTMYEELKAAALCVCENQYEGATECERHILQTYSLYRRMPKRSPLAKRERFPSLQAIQQGLSDSDVNDIHPILKVLVQVFETEYEAFWVFVTLWNKHKRVSGGLGTPAPLSGVGHRCRYLSELLGSRNYDLRNALLQVGLSERHYALRWFRTVFADLFKDAPELCMELWDSLLALPVDFSAYVAYELVVSMEDNILQIIKGANKDKHKAARRLRRAFQHPFPVHSEVQTILKKAVAAAPDYMLHENLEHEASGTVNHMQWPVCKLGDRDSTLVRVVQHLLKAHGYRLWFTLDGYYGPRTEHTVENFKTDIGPSKGSPKRVSEKPKMGQSLEDLATSLPTSDLASSLPHSASIPKELGPDSYGVVGPTTWPKLIVDIRTGVKGDAVKALQLALLEIHGYDEVRVDGYYGRRTNKAVIDFQKNKALNMIPIDGWVGPVTWIHLLGHSNASDDVT